MNIQPKGSTCITSGLAVGRGVWSHPRLHPGRDKGGCEEGLGVDVQSLSCPELRPSCTAYWALSLFSDSGETAVDSVH